MIRDPLPVQLSGPDCEHKGVSGCESQVELLSAQLPLEVQAYEVQVYGGSVSAVVDHRSRRTAEPESEH